MKRIRELFGIIKCSRAFAFCWTTNKTCNVIYIRYKSSLTEMVSWLPFHGKEAYCTYSLQYTEIVYTMPFSERKRERERGLFLFQQNIFQNFWDFYFFFFFYNSNKRIKIIIRIYYFCLTKKSEHLWRKR